MGNPLSGKTLTKESIQVLYENALRLETLFQEPVDIEWTGLMEEFTVLQVRPITVLKKDDNQERQWYLTLTPSGEKLLDLADRVEKVLIPELIKEGQQFAILEPKNLDQVRFLQELKTRGESHDRWEQVYREEFIPFAHGIRHFGSFYNDLMKPVDPYEFIYLLKNQDMLAHQRNRSMHFLADSLRDTPVSHQLVRQWMEKGYEGKRLLEVLEEACTGTEPITKFARLFLEFLQHEMDLSYDQVNLKEAPETTLRVILALANDVQQRGDLESVQMGKNLSDAFLQKAREGSLQEEAENWLRIGRVSWKLRDDDNLLLAKIENQLQTYLKEGLARLYDEKRIDRIPDKFDSKDWKRLYAGVAEKTSIPLPLDSEELSVITQKQIKARQLIGQPSSPGIYSGVARVIQSIRDFKGTAKGEVLVFDAVEPQMTFIISLAGAIVERRGGMLVHSSIIAREMNIPAVNGVPKATSLIQTGDYITVNGDLGIVVIGKPEFSIELGT
jgi:pyruvate,water dikinase